MTYAYEMCCIDSNQPAVLRRGQYAASCQLAGELGLLLLSVTTWRDGGFVGVGGGGTRITTHL